MQGIKRGMLFEKPGLQSVALSILGQYTGLSSKLSTLKTAWGWFSFFFSLLFFLPHVLTSSSFSHHGICIEQSQAIQERMTIFSQQQSTLLMNREAFSTMNTCVIALAQRLNRWCELLSMFHFSFVETFPYCWPAWSCC